MKKFVVCFNMLSRTPDLCTEPLIIIQLLALPSKVIYSKWYDVICCVEPCEAAQHGDLHVVYHVNDPWLGTPQGKTRPEAAHD